MAYIKKFLVVIFLCCPFIQYGQGIGGYFVAEQNNPLQPLQEYFLACEDSNSALTVENIISQKTDSDSFKPLSVYKEKDMHHSWWCLVTIHADYTIQNWHIALSNKTISGIDKGNDICDAYILDGNIVEHHYTAGNLTPVSQKPIAEHVNLNMFPVSIPAGETRQVIIHIQRSQYFIPLQFDFELQHPAMLQRAYEIDYYPSFPFYLGIMFILCMFGLAFLIITKERSFIWFIIITVCFLIHALLLHPADLFVQWIVPEHPVLQYYAWSLLTIGFVGAYWQFGRSFCRLKTQLPFWDKVIRAIICLAALYLLISIFLLAFAPHVQVDIIFTTLIFISSVLVGVRLLFIKERSARFFGIAVCWLFIFQVIGVLWNLGLVTSNFPNPWMTAQIGSIIIIFLGLAYRFKQSTVEKAGAEQILQMDAVKNRFYANISHEFRTPLTLIMGPLQQLEENTVDEIQKRKYLQMIRYNAGRLLHLINQLLDLSKIEGGNAGLSVKETDITHILKTYMQAYESLAEQKQIHFHMHFPHQNIRGFTDTDKLEKIITNLLSNAFRFTKENGSVSVSVEADEKRLRIHVQDTGIGIASDELHKIFDRFYQIKGTDSGTGIGLSLVKELVQLHKGQISVSSETGKGTKFRLSLPIAKEFYTAKEITKEEDKINFTPIIGETGVESDDVDADEKETTLPYILIVEDNTGLREFISGILKKDFNIITAADGREGLEKAITHIPDLILSDLMMPVMDGVELCNAVKQDEKVCHIPLILLTAKADKETRLEGLKTGADDYIVKPFDSNELLVRIHNLIEQRKKLHEVFSRTIISISPEEYHTDSPDQQFMAKVRTVIEQQTPNALFSVVDLADAVHMSRSQLHRKLTALTDMTPNELIRNFRLERALQLLEGGVNVSEAAFGTGFSSPAYFSKCFSERYGYAPGDVRKRIKNIIM